MSTLNPHHKAATRGNPPAAYRDAMAASSPAGTPRESRHLARVHNARDWRDVTSLADDDIAPYAAIASQSWE